MLELVEEAVPLRIIIIEYMCLNSHVCLTVDTRWIRDAMRMQEASDFFGNDYLFIHAIQNTLKPVYLYC